MTTTSSAALTEAQASRFRELVRDRSGLELGERRRADLDKAVATALERTGSSDPAALFSSLTDRDHGRPHLEAFIADLTIGETHFFRNKAQMQALEEEIIPDLVKRKRGVRRLRIWSAGCATGEEPYSLAILLERAIPDLANWNVTILATDINRQAIEKAQRGHYSSWSFREVPEEIERRYFSQQDGRYEVLPRIRKLVTFGYMNLITDAYPSLTTNTQSMDLILCRNVLIYFQEETTRKVVTNLYQSLVDGGWLVVGAAEPSQTTFSQFTVHNYPKTVVYQKALPGPAAAREAHPTNASLAAKPRPSLPSATPPPPPPGAPSVAAEKTEPDLSGPIPSVQDALEAITDGRSDDALSLLIRIVRTEEKDAYAACLIAKIYASKLELYEAEHWINIAIERDQLLAPAHYIAGLVLQEYGRLDGALASLRRCVYADPDFALGHFAMAGLLGRLGQKRRAEKELENVERILDGLDREALVPEGDGLTVGRLTELVEVHKELLEKA